MIGERGGSTATLDEGIARIEQHKPILSNAIRFDILDWLETHPEWHRNHLRVAVPADSKNAVGAVVNALIRSGKIEETGERRKSSDPASHGRKSNVYRLLFRTGTGSSRVDHLGTSAASSCGPGRTEGDATEGFGGQSSAGATSSAPVDPPRLFEVGELSRPDHYEAEAA